VKNIKGASNRSLTLFPSREKLWEKDITLLLNSVRMIQNSLFIIFSISLYYRKKSITNNDIPEDIKKLLLTSDVQNVIMGKNIGKSLDENTINRIVGRDHNH
jgi:hypothetical protein